MRKKRKCMKDKGKQKRSTSENTYIKLRGI